MRRYIFKRFLISIPILLLVVTLVFLAFQLIPGDPARMYVGVDASQEAVEKVRQDLGLDQPVWTQYVTYMSRLAVGDLGKSIYTRRPVVQELAPRFWNTVQLSLAAIVFATVIGVLLGTLATVKQGTGWIICSPCCRSSASPCRSYGWGFCSPTSSASSGTSCPARGTRPGAIS